MLFLMQEISPLLMHTLIRRSFECIVFEQHDGFAEMCVPTLCGLCKRKKLDWSRRIAKGSLRFQPCLVWTKGKLYTKIFYQLNNLHSKLARHSFLRGFLLKKIVPPCIDGSHCKQLKKYAKPKWNVIPLLIFTHATCIHYGVYIVAIICVY